MGRITVLDINNKQLGAYATLKLKELRKIIEKNSEGLLGITVLFTDYIIDTNDVIEVLGIDENYNLVVIEYRSNRYGKLINKGLLIIDYIRNNQSLFKMLIAEKINKEIVQNINYEPRLVIIGEDFTHYDEHAIKQIPCVIELVKWQVYGKELLLLEKQFQNTQIIKAYSKNVMYKKEELIKHISSFFLGLGDDVVEERHNGYFVYRKFKTFVYMFINENIEIKAVFKEKIARAVVKDNYFIKTYIIKTENDFHKIEQEIEKSYEQN